MCCAPVRLQCHITAPPPAARRPPPTMLLPPLLLRAALAAAAAAAWPGCEPTGDPAGKAVRTASPGENAAPGTGTPSPRMTQGPR